MTEENFWDDRTTPDARGLTEAEETMNKPNLNDARTEIYYMKAGKWICCLRPGGYLCSVTATVNPARMTWPENIPRDDPMEFKITSGSPAGEIVGEFKIFHHVGFHQGGIVFPKPMEHMNNANPYYVQSLTSTPDITLYVTQCWQER